MNLNAFSILVFSSMSAISIVLWQRLIFSRLWHRREIIERAPSIKAPFGLIDVAIMFAIWLFGQMISAFVIWKFQGSLTANLSVEQLGIISLAQLVTTFSGLLFLRSRYGSFKNFGMSLGNWRADLIVGLSGFLIVIPPILLLQFILTRFVPYQHQTLDALKNNPSFLLIFMAWFAAVLVAPVCEEIFFRGVLQGWFQNLFPLGKNPLEQVIAGKATVPTDEPFELPDSGEPGLDSLPRSAEEDGNPYSPVFLKSPPVEKSKCPAEPANFPAIFFSSLAFASVHIGQGAAPIPLFFLGLTLGYLFSRTNSLIPCILLHMGLNGFSMFWFTLSLLFEPAKVSMQ